ncbi:hypothetical protein GCM10010430_34980 [Kitasatospora cystarginea]|uniref:Histidine kinase/HSP90-like ATPase domain-containing protein n=1 Tax=Kitasatospora cystarginea TaxID=58350 RepID=A0ABN3E5L6_9ACTN
MNPALIRSRRLRINATGTWDQRAQAAHDGRTEVASIASGWGITGPDLDTVSLIASELITNAAMYAPGNLLVGVHLAPEGTAMVVEVYDGKPGTLAPTSTGDQDEHGRGLLLVDAMAAHWGVTATAHGKRTWAQIEVNPAVEVPAPSRATRRAALINDLIRCGQYRAVGATTHGTGTVPPIRALARTPALAR